MTSKSVLKTIQSTHEFFSNKAWIEENCSGELADLLIQHGSAIQGHIIAFMSQDPKKRNAPFQVSNALDEESGLKVDNEVPVSNVTVMTPQRDLSDQAHVLPLSPWPSMSDDVESQLGHPAVQAVQQAVSAEVLATMTTQGGGQANLTAPPAPVKRGRGRPRSAERQPVGIVEINRMVASPDGQSQREKVMVDVYPGAKGGFYYMTPKGNHIKIDDSRIRMITADGGNTMALVQTPN